MDDSWGPRTVDRFATHYNAQLERFNSRYACPGSEAVDSFTSDWGGENNWWCPPPCLVARVIGHAEVCKAQGTLIIPAWQSAHYYGVSFAPFVVDMVSLPLYTELVHPDVFSSGVWPLLSNLDDPELRRLAKALPATVLKCKADSTTKNLGAFQRRNQNSNYFLKFQEACGREIAEAANRMKELNTYDPTRKIQLKWYACDSGKSRAECAKLKKKWASFPVQDIHLVLYLQHLSESIQSKSAVEEVVHAVSRLHQMARLSSIAGSPIVQATLGGLRRELAKPKKRKEPVTAEMLLAMVEAAGPSPSLTEIRLLAICLVAFAGFLRCEELLKLRCADVTFNTEGMVIHIASSKTDQYREGVARTGTATCPVSMMQRYFSMGQLMHDSQDFIFRGIMHTKSGE
ncbi:hypothetical protein EMCRGX_G013893 [Ephydatia muelleri]